MRAFWSDIYAIEIFGDDVTLNSAISRGPEFTAETSGVTGVKQIEQGGYYFENVHYNLLPTEKVEFKGNANLIQKKLLSGLSMGIVESISPSTDMRPEPVTIPVLINSNNLTQFLRLLFQRGVSQFLTSEGGITNTECLKYIESTTIRFASLLKLNQQVNSENQPRDFCIHGAIVKTINLKGETGGVVEGSVEFIGSKFSQENYANTNLRYSNAALYDYLQPFRFQDIQLISSILDRGDQLDIVSPLICRFDLTISNNAVVKYYNSPVAKNIILGELDVSGTITIPWSNPDSTTREGHYYISAYRQGLTLQLSIILQNPTQVRIDTSAPLLTTIHLSARIEDYNEDEIDGQPVLNIKFKALKDTKNDGDSSVYPITILAQNLTSDIFN